MSDLNDIMNMSNSEMDKILEGFVGKPRKEVEYELAVIRQEIQVVANTIPSKGNQGEQGPQGVAGKDGVQGKNGKDGLQGPRGFDGKDGKDGLDGEKGQDGVSVVNAYLDFDNSLTLELSDGSVIDAGQFTLPENIQNIIQSLKQTGPSTLASLDDVNVASATDSQVLTYNSATSKWIPATVSAGGGGTVTSVAATAGTGISITGSPITSSGTFSITNTAPDQVVSLTAGSNVTITGTYPSFTIASSGGGGGGGSSLTIDNKTAAYTIVTGDLGKVINCTSGTFTVSLTAAATLGSGFNVTIWNTSSTSTHVITIDPNGAETIDGSTTITLRLGEGTEIVSNGTNWITGNKKSMRYYAENATTLLRPVASGVPSIAMGNGGYASGNGAIAIGNGRVDGYSGATQIGAIAIGGGARGTGSYGVSIGQDSNALGNSSIGIGASATAQNTNSIAIGNSSNANANDAMALGNGFTTRANAVSINGYNSAVNAKYTFGTPMSSSLGGTGGTQAGKYILGIATTNGTSAVLVTFAGTASSTNQISIPDKNAIVFTGQIVCRQQPAGGNAASAFKIEGLLRRDTGVGTTTLVASTVTAISNAAGYTVALSANTTIGCLTITVTGAAATNLRWLATVETTEISYEFG
jgi:hypothetical protein